MSSKLPIGVATIVRPLIILFISYIFIFIISCTPTNLSKQFEKKTQENVVSKKSITPKSKNKVFKKKEDHKNKLDDTLRNVVLDKTLIVLFAKDDDTKTTKQFLNTYELGIHNLEVKEFQKVQVSMFQKLINY